jgi:Ca2+-transporting ATPase
VSVICTDKTGTLTCNRMALEAVWLPRCGETPEPLRPLLLLGAALCSNVHLGAAGPEGDPTETALLQEALQKELDPAAFAGRRPRARELPFDSHRRMMTVVLEWNDDATWFEPAGRLALTKGTPHEVFRHCRWIAVGRDRQPLDEGRWREVVAANDELAGRGCRVLALALRPGDGELLAMEAQELERELVFVGLLALYDPPRPGVEQAIAECHSAGIEGDDGDG